MAFLLEDLKKDLKNPVAKHILTTLFLKDFLVILVILAFLNHPLVQVSIPLLLNSTILITMITSGPFKANLTNCFRIIDSVSETLNLITFVLLILFKGKDEKFKYKHIGSFMVFSMLMTLSAYTILSFIDLWVVLKRFCQKDSKSKKKVRLSLFLTFKNSAKIKFSQHSKREA